MLSSDGPSPFPSPPWAPPKAPIPPQRLAKLANALGVPIPAVSTSLARSQSDVVIPPARSPTPSTATSSVSRYLLHVIPPLYLPHRSDDPNLTAPSPLASGYHTQYRRGILVPVFANFQSQLAAIAREYALPSTAGIILYLVTSLNGGAEPLEEQPNEPGPRLSEGIWKHIWTRVIRAEHQDDNILPQSPQLYRLGTQSSNFLSQENRSALPQLRPLIFAGTPKPQSIASTFTSSSSVSSTYDLRLNSRSPSLPDPDTPDTSSPSQASLDEAATKANTFVLPGLNSPSLIPVLAKVEFHIDRQKAGWYEPWLRSRRLNQAKRARRRQPEATGDEGQSDESQGKGPPLALLTGTKGAAIPQDAHLSNGSDLEDNSEDVTARFGTARKPPPLVLVPNVQNVELGVPSGLSPALSSASSVRLAYLKTASPNNTGGSDEELDGYTRIRRPEESEKRVGGIFDDLDLGLDPSGDLDDYDLNDRRRSQLLMKAKLDEIERTMLQLSPRALKSAEEDPIVGSPSKSIHLSPSPERNDGPRPPELRRIDDDTFRESQNTSQAWPAVPYAALKESRNLVQTGGPPSPPHLAVNGVSATAPMHYIPPTRSSSLEVSPETQQRRKELEEEYPSNFVKVDDKVALESSIPLSPDPFNRYPSTQEGDGTTLTNVGSILGLQGPATNGRTRASTITTVASRFSVDSTDEVITKPNNRTTLVSMKSIKRLWRRSDKSSNQPPPRPERPSQEELDLPSIPDIVPSHRNSPTPGFVATGRPSVEQLAVPPPVKGFVPSPHLEGLHFNQESPYPSRLPPIRYSPTMAPPALPAQEPEKPTRKSILKWRSKSRVGSISQNVAGAQESRASTDQSRPPSSASSIAPSGMRSRQLSISGLNTGHGPTSSVDIPPSPRIPEHFLSNSRQAAPLSLSSSGKQQSNDILPRSSTDSQATSEYPPLSRSPSPRHSMTSSRDSHGERPSFDASQFEIISPKTAALAYPYHELDI
ncbi:hypothetical protein AX15_005995 [Amanita polypyramis BW_CC]|nr:hypothetical protein AX15_005995 [Amanita polypyramis BW_CC]